MTEEEKKIIIQKNILDASLMAINLLHLWKKEKKKYCITKNSLQYSLQNSLQNSLQYSLQHRLQNSLQYSLQYSQMKKCIIDTSGTVCLLITFQFIKKIPGNSKIFYPQNTYTPNTPNTSYTPNTSMTPIHTKSNHIKKAYT